MVHHLAIIMDGNRRWAKKRSLMPWKGHEEGITAVKRAVEFCLEQNIKTLSLFTFSQENFQKRSAQEQHFLFDIIIQQSEKMIDDLVKNEICLNFIGDRAQFPRHVNPAITKLEQATAHAKKLNLNMLFCYGSQQEIVAATKQLIHDISTGSSFEFLDESLFRKYLWTGSSPDPDIILRTGGVKRLSNFLLFQSAYSELFFLDCLWPDLTKNDLANVVQEFESRKRNFGS